MPGYHRQGHRGGGGRCGRRFLDYLQESMLLSMQTDTKSGSGHFAGSDKRNYSELHWGFENHNRMDKYDSGATYWYDWDVFGPKQAREVKSEKNRGDQAESRGGVAGYRERAVSRTPLYGFSEIIRRQKLQSQRSQGTIRGRGDESRLQVLHEEISGTQLPTSRTCTSWHRSLEDYTPWKMRLESTENIL